MAEQLALTAKFCEHEVGLAIDLASFPPRERADEGSFYHCNNLLRAVGEACSRTPISEADVRMAAAVKKRVATVGCHYRQGKTTIKAASSSLELYGDPKVEPVDPHPGDSDTWTRIVFASLGLE